MLDIQMLSSSKTPDAVFVSKLPKIELHAHLSGSINRECLQRLWEKRKALEPALELAAPIDSMLPGKVDYDIQTPSLLVPDAKVNVTVQILIASDITSIRLSTLSVLQDFADDGVVYLELRTTPRAVPSEGISKRQYVQAVLSCIKEFGHSMMKVFLILSVDRKNTVEEAMEVVDLAIEYKSRGVVGVDLCGNPSKGDVTVYQNAFSKAKAHGLGLTVHFAEVEASSTDFELDTLLSYQPDRLGHVIHVPQHIKDEIEHRRLGLELCLSCNVLAKLSSGSFPDHHFGYWRDKACPIALGTDDVGIFCSSLSDEYSLAAKHFNLNCEDLIDLSLQASQCIFGPSEEKERLVRALQKFKADYRKA